ncbi:MAG: extracellular solute-binding protein [Treponema sp.]|nr:extracellular solute-binding protein [Candidatus Treponema caballi]
MKTKVLVLLIAAVLAVTMITGCTGKSSDSKAAEATTAQAPAKKQTDGKNVPVLTTEPMTIILWDISTENPGKAADEAAVQRFMADYPNITVKQVHQLNDNYKQQLVVAMSSGQAPNMYIHWGGGPMAEYYKSGFVNDITEMYAKYDHPAFIDAAVGQSTYDGKMLAIPFGGLSGCDVFYNKTIFANLGIKVPETIDELEAACETLKANGITPFSLANASKWTGSMYYMYLVARHSGNAEFDAAYTQKNGGTFTSPAFIYAGEKIQEWVRKGYFPDGVNSLSADDNQDRALLYDGSAAMMLHGSWQVSGIKADSEEWYNENISVFRFPEDTAAKAAGVPQDVEIGTAIGTGFSFNCFNKDGSVNQAMLDACYVLATQYFNDDIYNKTKMDTGTVPSIKGFNTNIDDPNNKTVIDIFFDASNVQLWYDQYLPASVTEVHKNCMTELFGLVKTPKEIGEAQDAAMKKALAE